MSTIILKNKRRIKRLYNQKIKGWKYPFNKVDIPSSVDGNNQKAYYYNPKSETKSPLLVSLHSWAGDYNQIDPILSSHSVNAGWNYIHPDFRGKNNSPQACGSELAMSDINDAIQYAIDNGNVDVNNIFIAGGSGGAYASLCFYSSADFPINSYFAWSPITDLIAWHDQSIIRGLNYSHDILKGTNSADSLNIQEAKRRSPLYRDMSRTDSNLHIFTGYHDGYASVNENPVPITHSINFYNQYISTHNAETTDFIPKDDIIRLAVREYQATNDTIDGRKVIYSKVFKNTQLTIFDGGHEQLERHTIKLVNENLK